MFEHMLRRTLLLGRQDSALQLCLTNCLTSAVYDSINTCNLDVACMCGEDGFRASTLNCAKTNCTSADISESIIESSLTSVLDQCADGAFSVPTSSTDDDVKTTTRGRATQTSTPSSSKDDGPSTGLIVGAVVGGIALVALFGVLIWWLVKRSKRRAAVENKPAFFPASGPVTPGLDDSKIGGVGQPTTQMNQPGGFVVGYNGQPYQQYTNTTASTNYANSTATGPGGFAKPHAELGYVPPSQFDQFGAGAMGAGGAGAAAFATGNSGPQQRPTSHYPAQTSSSGGSSSGAQLLTTATPPSQSGSSGSRPGTSDAGVGGFNPYLQHQQQQPAPLQLHQAQYDPYAAAAGGSGADKWPADVKRPLNVMSADETSRPQEQQGDLPPPMYTRQ